MSKGLDVEPLEALDQLTRLATELLAAPVSLVTLVTPDAQRFIGATGLSEPSASERESPLSHSVCKHVVARDAQVLISDTAGAPDLEATVPWEHLGVHAYAGVPLRVDDEPVGAFCAVDNVAPREWTARDIAVLEGLAAVATEVIAARRAIAGNQLRDGLTGLPSRRMFSELISRALARGEDAAVVALGLDGFRLINEAYGHAAGDGVIRDVALRLTDLVEDPLSLARVGGDEFLVFFEGVADDGLAQRLARRVREAAVGEPFLIDGSAQPVGASVGVAIAHEEAGPEELVEAAMSALAVAKTGVKAGIERADPARRGRAGWRLLLRNEIQGAQRRDELGVVYQPLVDLDSGRVCSLEALLRWEHPQIGPVSPNDFVPAAEVSGAIVAIGAWVLRRACEDLVRWRSSGCPDLKVAVNVAPVQMRAPGFAEMVAVTLEASGLPPTALTLEIVERTLLDDRPSVRHAFEQLGALGVHIALDDFGSGYSALGYLARFPIDTIKLDRIFVAGLEGVPRNAALAEAILGMADGLGLSAVAEGIETAAQLETLKGIGYGVGQGFLFARPAACAKIPDLLTRSLV